jgi:hypothetical protein
VAKNNSNGSTNSESKEQAAQTSPEEEEAIVAPEEVVRGHEVAGVALEGEDSPEWVLHHQQYTIGYPGFTGPLSADEYAAKLKALQRKAKRAELNARKAARSAAGAAGPAGPPAKPKAARRSRAKAKGKTAASAPANAPASADPKPSVGTPVEAASAASQEVESQPEAVVVAGAAS